MSRFQKCFPRPVIVCPDELSNTTGILIAYDGSLPGGLCKCSHFSGSDSIESFRSCLSMQAMNWFPYAAPRNIFDFIATTWTRPGYFSIASGRGFEIRNS
jgi:hypothetical protein